MTAAAAFVEVMPQYKNLEVWQYSMALAKAVYVATRTYPVSETYGLRAQMRRAACSIPVNLAEGKGRRTDAELNRFLGFAYGSLLELETEIILSRQLGLISQTRFAELSEMVERTAKMLNKLRSRLHAVPSDDRPEFESGQKPIAKSE